MAMGIEFVDGENVNGGGPGSPQPNAANGEGGTIQFVDGHDAGGPSKTGMRGRMPSAGDVVEGPND